MDKERAAQLVEAGIWLRLSGDSEGARRLLERALKLDPTNEKARQLLEPATAAAPPAPPPENPFDDSGGSVAPAIRPIEPREQDAGASDEVVIDDGSMTVDSDWGDATGFNTPEAPQRPHVPAPPLPIATVGKSISYASATASAIAPPGGEGSPPVGASVPESTSVDPGPAQAPAGTRRETGTIVFGQSVPDLALSPSRVPPRAEALSSGTLRSAGPAPTGGTLRFGGAPPEESAAPPPIPATTLRFGNDGAEAAGSAFDSLDDVAVDEEVAAPESRNPGSAFALAPSTITISGDPQSDLERPREVWETGATGASSTANGRAVAGFAPPPPPLEPPAPPPPPPWRPLVGSEVAEVRGAASPSGIRGLLANASPSSSKQEPPPEAPDPAWNWTPTRGPDPLAARPEDEEWIIGGPAPVARPSPGLAPHAESAWDQRGDPGIKVLSAGGTDVALDQLASNARPSAVLRENREAEVRSLLRAARDLLGLDDHSGAMELITRAQQLAPDHVEVTALRERSEKTLLAMYESKLGNLSATPRVLLKDDEIIWLNLDHRAGFVLAQIDGAVCFEDLFAVSGMTRLDTARILAQLVDEGVISRG